MRLACALSKTTSFRFSFILKMKESQNYWTFGVTLPDRERRRGNNFNRSRVFCTPFVHMLIYSFIVPQTS